MAFEDKQIIKIKKSIDEFFELCRPSEKIRHIYDLGYSIEDRSVAIFEIRTLENGKKIYPSVAKATYYRTRNIWRIYWKRADLKWHPYVPDPVVLTFKRFLKIVSEDKFHCFFG